MMVRCGSIVVSDMSITGSIQSHPLLERPLSVVEGELEMSNREPICVEYKIQCENSSERRDVYFPLMTVSIEEIEAPVVTLTGAIGFAIEVTLTYQSSPGMSPKVSQGIAVWHPADDYSFALGAKIALRRAVKHWKSSVFTSTFVSKQAFRGLMAFLEITDTDDVRGGALVLQRRWRSMNG